jgi:acetyl-CoA carboxylase carboxyltransferase component
LTARPAKSASAGRLGQLSQELKELRDRLRGGGGPERIQRQHEQRKLTARERVALLLDPGAPSFEIGLLVACDLYDGQAPAAGVVTCVRQYHSHGLSQ